jgi:hypothetical protein
VVIRKAAARAPIQAPDHQCGPQPDRKKLAIGGAVYARLPYVRTPKHVGQGLFRIPTAANAEALEPRPTPIAKALRASRTHTDAEGVVTNARATLCAGRGAPVRPPDPQGNKALVVWMDGQHGLWEDAAAAFAGRERVEIVDLLHATSTLWDLVPVCPLPGSAHELDAMKLFTLCCTGALIT